MLTIGELASYAGVTTRTVRHYHAIGLLPEPARDHSGYRRYSGHDVIQLARITTLARAGIPLARIPVLLDAPNHVFSEALADLDNDLAHRMDQLRQHRQQLKLLAADQVPALPPPVRTYLEALRDAGVGERTIAYERQTWILLVALYPDDAPGWAALKTRLLDDATIVHLYRQMDDAIDWDPSDPRLARIAADTIAITRTDQPKQDPIHVDRRLARLLEAYTHTAPPSWTRLQQLLSKS